MSTYSVVMHNSNPNSEFVQSRSDEAAKASIQSEGVNLYAMRADSEINRSAQKVSGSSRAVAVNSEAQSCKIRCGNNCSLKCLK